MMEKTEQFDSGRWCILRTSGSRTLPLAAALAAEGFDVWTPARTFTRVKRGKALAKPVKYEVTAPILPTFVFARLPHLPALVAAAADQASTLPAFSVFTHAGRAARIRDSEIAALRAAEEAAADVIAAERDADDRESRRQARAAVLRTAAARRKALRAERRLFEAGTSVQVKDAPALRGMTGVIESGDGRSFLVAFGGSLCIEIEAWQLLPVAVEDRATSAA